MESVEIAIRSIQHYLYCPHRWGLMEVNCAWAENWFVTKGNLLHQRVSDSKNSYFLRGKCVFTSVKVYNDSQDYNIHGIVDCIEVVENPEGVEVCGDKNKYSLCIVEYKPTKPKRAEYNFDDLMQVYAQKLCVDNIFGCDAEAFVYYADVKKRIKLPVVERHQELDDVLKRVLREMRYNIETGTIPPIEKGQKCQGCSMMDMCMPKIKRNDSVCKQIANLLKDG